MKGALNNKGRWNPYLAGCLSGVVIVLSVWLAGKYAGASTSFVQTAGMVEKLFVAERVAGIEYFAKYSANIEWQWMFVIGILIGSLIAAVSSQNFTLQAVPPMWRKKFGGSIPKRAGGAFLGGLVAMYGARLADG